MAVAVPVTQSPAVGLESEVSRLYEEHSERLLGYCLRFLGSRADAEDAVQTTFLYAHRALERGVVPELEYAWLHSIAKNVCRWQLRTLSRRGSLTTDLDLDAMPGRADDDLDARELREELREALASIPESQRRAFVLREWHGLDSNEVASQLGMSPTATYALLTRARRSLAKAMSTAGRTSLFGVDFVFGKLKMLLAGGGAKVAATTVLAGSLAIGGVAVERAVDRPRAPQKAEDVATPANGEQVRDALLTPSSSKVVTPGARGATVAVPARDRPSNPALGPTGTPNPPSEPGAVDPGAVDPGVAPTTSGGGSEPTGERPKVEEPREAVPLVPVVEDVVDPLLEDPLLDPLDPVLDPLAPVVDPVLEPLDSLPPVDVDLPLDDPASVTNDVEDLVDAVVPDAPLPAPVLSPIK